MAQKPSFSLISNRELVELEGKKCLNVLYLRYLIHIHSPSLVGCSISAVISPDIYYILLHIQYIHTIWYILRVSVDTHVHTSSYTNNTQNL